MHIFKKLYLDGKNLTINRLYITLIAIKQGGALNVKAV